jgi:hypothetical protein
VSYSTIIPALATRLETVDGIRAVLPYEPKTVSNPPVLYFLLDSVVREQTAQLTIMRYRILCRLCIRWQDNERAEQEIFPFVNSIPAAIDTDPQLGGALNKGMSHVTEIRAGWIPISGVTFRILDFYVEAVQKATVRSGI